MTKMTEREARQAIVEIGRLLYERQLTNSAGGNVSLRMGERVFISPRYAGSRFRWRLRPEQIVMVHLHAADALNTPGFSREGRAHLGLYRAFPTAGGIIHAHPRYVTVFASAGKPIPPVLEYTQKFGAIEPIPFAPAHSQELADNIVEAILAKRAEFERHGLAVLMPTHGMIALGRDLDDAFDVVERADFNAMSALLGRLIEV
jgi:L-fuculose-phosphate aldolase